MEDRSDLLHLWVESVSLKPISRVAFGCGQFNRLIDPWQEAAIGLYGRLSTLCKKQNIAISGWVRI